MSSAIHVAALSLKNHIKMVRRRNSAPMKHVQLDHLRKRERKKSDDSVKKEEDTKSE